MSVLVCVRAEQEDLHPRSRYAPVRDARTPAGVPHAPVHEEEVDRLGPRQLLDLRKSDKIVSQPLDGILDATRSDQIGRECADPQRPRREKAPG